MWERRRTHSLNIYLPTHVHVLEMQHAENAEHEHDGEEGNGITATPLTSGGDMVSRDESVIMAGSDADKAADFANCMCR
jgi:hypothetical protein